MAESPQNQQTDPNVQDESGVVLLLQVPRTNEKKELAAEQMFASLHGLLTLPSQKRFKSPVRERLSFEIAVLNKRIGFYVWVPNYLKSFVEEQIYAQYPTVQISEVPDYTKNHDPAKFPTTLLCEMKLVGNDALPIKTFQSFEVDPLAAITATLSKFDEDEEAWVQLVLRPAAGNWHRKSEKYVAGLRGGGKGKIANPASLVGALWAPPEEGKGESVAKLTEYETSRAGAAEEKSHKLAFEASLRIAYLGRAPLPHAKLRLQSIIASYKQFNTTYLNGFEQRRMHEDPRLLSTYSARDFRAGQILNIEEVATLYHLPHTNVETPYILWALSQTAEPPANLPIVVEAHNPDISPVATTNFRGHNTMFGMPRIDRGRHLYIIGQTGVGKSGLLELLTISDIYSPFGFAVIDPHGDYAQNILKRIPAERAEDVIYFNPADTDFPIAFNPMEVQDPKLRTHTASELIGVLKRMFDSWGPRLEYILRYTLLALLDYPDATMLDITRLLTDKRFRQEVLKYVNDPVVRNFWEIEFASWNDKFAAEAVAPVLNKVGAFTANPLVRNIIGQPKSSFNLRQIMDQRKILIVNLSRGLVGEDNAALLGALLVTKIQLGAMSRADIPASERSPFYLYVDEFQNFATDSFATILSEARKYGLNLTVANQYIAQMSMEVKDAVFGNVGSIVAFRMGVDDARNMQRYFEPRFLEYDLVHMHNRHFVVSMTIEGEKIPGFSAISLNLPPDGADYTAHIIERSRSQYAVSREFVDRYVSDRYLVEAKNSGSKPATAKADSSEAKSASKPKPAVTDKASDVKPAVFASKPNSTGGDAPTVRQSIGRAAVAEPTPVSAPTASQPAPKPSAEKPEANNPNADPATKPKRKRTRKRKKKTDQPSAATQTATAVPEVVKAAAEPATDPTALHIQH